MKLNEVSANYDRAARHYDRLADIVFGRLLNYERFRKHSVEALGELSGATVLDVGCGTGRNFPLLIPRVGRDGRVVAVDYSEGMLAKAEARIEKMGATNIELLRGDAAKLEGVPEQVDALISVWCLGIVEDLDGALNRGIDVVRPGGRIVIMDFGRSRAERGLLRHVYPLYSRLLRRLGIDSADDMDDAKLRAKWKRGRAILHRRLVDVQEQEHGNGVGFILSGKVTPSS